MKRLSFLSCLYFFILVFTINNFCVVNIHNTHPKVLFSQAISCFKELPKPSWSQEGFCTDTFVKTNIGYRSIQECVTGDILIGCDDQEKKIISITKKFVKHYVRLVVDDIVMYVGCDQQYCILPEHTWKPAKTIKVGDLLLNNSDECCVVTEVRVIERETLLYSFTVEDHIFYIAPGDICVHNAEAVMLGAAATVCLEYITLVNPIIATIGATTALSTIVYKLCSGQKEAASTSVLLPECSYYEQRKIDLINIRQELLCVKNDLMNIKAFCGNGALSFTPQFFQQNSIVDSHCQNHWSKISFTDEMQLSEQQKIDLRNAREAELCALEQDIIALQCMLALHCNTVIEQVHALFSEFKTAQEQTRVTRALWNKNLGRLTDSIVLQSYKAEIIEDFLINSLDQKVMEVKAIAQYYRKCMSAQCLKESTNIIDLLAAVDPVIVQWEQILQEAKKRVTYSMSLDEQYFVRRGISIIGIKNETRIVLEQAQKNNAAKRLAQVQNKLSSMVSAGGPYKDPKKDDESGEKQDFAKIEIYEQNAKHIFRDEVGHLPDTPANRKLLIDMASDKNNFLGTCKFGNHWYSKTLKNGQQVWASVRNGFIRNGGLNNVVRKFSFETGLANMKG